MPNNHAHYVSFPVPLEQGPLESDYSSAGIQRPENFHGDEQSAVRRAYVVL